MSTAPDLDDLTRDAHQRFLRTKFFGSLDGLRGISIIAVVWHHSAHYHGGILGRGHLGVQLFFAISGLLITTLLLREQAKSGTISLRGFYIRRTLRIFPLYYAVVALYMTLVALMERGTPAGREFFSNLPAYLTYTSNWFVDIHAGPRVIFYFAWSLATEEQFYLVWPWAVRFARVWYLPVLFMTALLIGGESVRWAASSGWLDDQALWARVVSSIASPICLGCIAAYLLHRPGGFRLAYRVAGQRWSAWLAAALLVACLVYDGTPMLLISLAMAYLVATCAIRPDHGLRRVLENAPLRHVGTVSYGMYLLHMLAINTVRLVVSPHRVVAIFALALPLTVLAATISYRWFEQRFLKLKERFSALGSSAPAAVPAGPLAPAGPPPQGS